VREVKMCSKMAFFDPVQFSNAQGPATPLAMEKLQARLEQKTKVNEAEQG
jgi:hypothetical protein